jgi:hypothetical protein
MGKQDQQPGLEKTHKTLGFLGYCPPLPPLFEWRHWQINEIRV